MSPLPPKKEQMWWEEHWRRSCRPDEPSCNGTRASGGTNLSGDETSMRA